MVDVQERLLPSIAEHESVTRNCVRLLKAADVLKVPVLYTEQYPKGIGSTVAPLLEALPASTPRFEKTAFSCCGEPGFKEKFGELQRKTAVLFGIETHICILSTAADLVGEGYDVVLASDACSSRNPDNHATALAALRSLGCTVVPTEAVVYRLLGAAGTPEFKALLPLFK